MMCINDYDNIHMQANSKSVIMKVSVTITASLLSKACMGHGLFFGSFPAGKLTLENS